MSGKRYFFLLAAALFPCGLTAGEVSQESASKMTTTTTETVVTKTVVRETTVQEKKVWSPFRVCILDFTTPDIKGDKRFLSEKNQPIVIPPQCTLNDADRASIHRFTQGYVRMIDARDTARTNEANRVVQMDDNRFNRTRALELYRKTVQGEARPVLLGADYLSSYLGRHSDVFSCMEPALMEAAMQKLAEDPAFPDDFLVNLARRTNATHLIYGTVSDIRSKTKSFKGYGIETKSTEYQLDVIVKVVDLPAQRIVYSNVYTGSCLEQQPIGETPLDSNIYQSLMKSAMEQAAAELYEICKPGPKNKITVTPLALPAPAAAAENK